MGIIVMIGSGLLFLAIGVYVWGTWEHFKRGASKARGIVVGNSRNRRREEGEGLYAPVIEFHDPSSGRPWVFQSSVYTGRRRRIGSMIPVLYRPEDPEDARTDTISQRLVPLLFMVAGIFLIIIAGKQLLFPA